MSIQVMAQVWKSSKAKSSSLLLQLAIADFAHDDGTGAYPSLDTLSKKVRMSKRQVRRLLGILRDMGEIQIERRNSRSTPQYSVNPGGDKLSPEADKMSTHSDKMSALEDIAMSPESLLNHQVNHKEPGRPPKTLTPQQAMVKALAEVMGIDDILNGARLAALASQLFKRGGTPELVQSRYGRGGWYYSADWRGKRGELPNEKAIRETWGRWTTEAERPALGPYREEE